MRPTTAATTLAGPTSGCGCDVAAAGVCGFEGGEEPLRDEEASAIGDVADASARAPLSSPPSISIALSSFKEPSGRFSSCIIALRLRSLL